MHPQNTFTASSSGDQEFAAPVAICRESRNGFVPVLGGYLRVHQDHDNKVFVSFAPMVAGVPPVAISLDLGMTIQEAIDSIGPAGQQIIEWASGHGAQNK